MKKEYDFSKGQRGKFYKPDIKLSLPVYIDQDLKKYFPDSESVNEAHVRQLWAYLSLFNGATH